MYIDTYGDIKIQNLATNDVGYIKMEKKKKSKFSEYQLSGIILNDKGKVFIYIFDLN